jgi:DNA-directed RNA polymerase subunit M/transcription elongation factor TFIIS
MAEYYCPKCGEKLNFKVITYIGYYKCPKCGYQIKATEIEQNPAVKTAHSKPTTESQPVPSAETTTTSQSNTKKSSATLFNSIKTSLVPWLKMIAPFLFFVVAYLFGYKLIYPFAPDISEWLIVFNLLVFIFLLWVLKFPSPWKQILTVVSAIVILFFVIKIPMIAELLSPLLEMIKDFGKMWKGMWCSITTGGDSSCFEKEENVEKIGTYDSLSAKLGRKISNGNYIPNLRPEEGEDYNLEITLENENDPTTNFDIEVIDVTACASSRRFDTNSDCTSDFMATSSKTPYTIRAGTYRIERLKFDTLPSCDYYMYFLVQAKSKQKGGGSSNFRIIFPVLEKPPNIDYEFVPSLKTQPGPIDAYVYTYPAVINLKEGREFEIIVRLVNKGDEGTATINNVTISSASEDLEITCPDFTTESCFDQQNCVTVYLSDSENILEKGDVKEIQCVGNIDPGYFTERETAFIGVLTYYEYTQDFYDFPAMLATCDRTTQTTTRGTLQEDYCTGTATLCDSLSHSDCGDVANSPQYGCQWLFGGEGMEYCVGTATACSSLTDETKCESQKGCSWVDVKQKIADIAKENGVPADYMLAIVQSESNFDHLDSEGNVIQSYTNDFGIMQIHVYDDDHTDCGMSKEQIMELDNNILCGVEIFHNKYNSYKDGMTITQLNNCGDCCHDPTYQSMYASYREWDAATRGYNGWGCPTEANAMYVETVKSRLGQYSNYE